MPLTAWRIEPSTGQAYYHVFCDKACEYYTEETSMEYKSFRKLECQIAPNITNDYCQLPHLRPPRQQILHSSPFILPSSFFIFHLNSYFCTIETTKTVLWTNR